MENYDESFTTNKILLGVSKCLIGESVRYDGKHKLMPWIIHSLQEYTSLIPLCPEVEMGLGIPRPPISLFNVSNEIKLRENESGIDHTDIAKKTISELTFQIKSLDGYIFKKGSPSCGLKNIKVFENTYQGEYKDNGQGLFAKAIVERFPKIIYVEESDLKTLIQREAFLIRLYMSKSSQKKNYEDFLDLPLFNEDSHELFIKRIEKILQKKEGIINSLYQYKLYPKEISLE